MEIIDYVTDLTTKSTLPDYYKTIYPDSRLLFFDIETTGFAAQHTTLYLIGVLWYEEDRIHIRQWFNEDGYSESQLLTAFDAFCKEFTHLVHFNGLGFDIPYLRQKASTIQHSTPSWETLQQIDIFRLIRPYKDILGLANLKQTSLEDYLGITRKDTYNGKELIHVYQKYVARPNDTSKQLLLLHNHDDLLGMPQVSMILNYTVLFENCTISDIEIKSDGDKLELSFVHSFASFLPKRLAITQNSIYLNAFEQTATIWIPIRQTTMKHYFKDYSNYYYLPQEDMAIHKSIATYVEPEHRTKATKNTCYIKQTGTFIPCFCPDTFEIFQDTADSKNYYQSLSSFTDAREDIQLQYIHSILHSFL